MFKLVSGLHKEFEGCQVKDGSGLINTSRTDDIK